MKLADNELAHAEHVADAVINNLTIEWADKLGGPHPWTETPEMSRALFAEVKRLLIDKLGDVRYDEIYSE